MQNITCFCFCFGLVFCYILLSTVKPGANKRVTCGYKGNNTLVYTYIYLDVKHTSKLKNIILTTNFSQFYLFSAAIFAAVVRGSLAVTLKGLPVIAFPFCISAGLFLLVTSNSKQLIRVPMDQITCPEEHRRKFKPGSSNAVTDNPA